MPQKDAPGKSKKIMEKKKMTKYQSFSMVGFSLSDYLNLVVHVKITLDSLYTIKSVCDPLIEVFILSRPAPPPCPMGECLTFSRLSIDCHQISARMFSSWAMGMRIQ